MLFIGIILVFLAIRVIWVLYQFFYYEGDKFNRIKTDLNKYTRNCNALNNHIEELKLTFLSFKKTNFGVGQIIDNSKYKYLMKEHKNSGQSDYIFDCSSSVFNNTRIQPYKYLCKYFNITVDEASLVSFEKILNNFSAAEEGVVLLNNELNRIISMIKNDIPFLIHLFGMKKFKKKLGFNPINCDIYFPTYIFRYISPGGNKSLHNKIVLNIDKLNEFIEYLSGLIKYKKSSAGQRALMTSKLRESIKKRDHYTCQICGISPRDEANILLEIDHIVPISKGGVSTLENLQVLCWKCNRNKGAKMKH